MPLPLALLSLLLAPAPAGDWRAKVEAHVRAHQSAILREFVELLAIPNLASDGPNIRRNAEHIARMLERRGVAARLLDGEGGPPAVYGELRTPGARRTVALLCALRRPARGSREVGESSLVADAARRAAGRRRAGDPARLLAVSRASGASTPAPPATTRRPSWASWPRSTPCRPRRVPLSVNLKFFFEGEEEAGSSHLEAVLAQEPGPAEGRRVAALRRPRPPDPPHAGLLRRARRDRPGADASTVPLRALHSGHYGNWAPNPAVALAELVAGLRDADGRIKVAGFYDDVRPPSAAERAALRRGSRRGRGAAEGVRARRDRGGRGAAGGSDHAARPERAGDGERRGGGAGGERDPHRGHRLHRLPPGAGPDAREGARRGWRRTFAGRATRSSTSARRRRMRRRSRRGSSGSTGDPAIRRRARPWTCRSRGRSCRVAEEAAGGPVVSLPTLGGSVPMHLFVETFGVPIVGCPSRTTTTTSTRRTRTSACRTSGTGSRSTRACSPASVSSGNDSECGETRLWSGSNGNALGYSWQAVDSALETLNSPGASRFSSFTTPFSTIIEKRRLRWPIPDFDASTPGPASSPGSPLPSASIRPCRRRPGPCPRRPSRTGRSRTRRR